MHPSSLVHIGAVNTQVELEEMEKGNANVKRAYRGVQLLMTEHAAVDIQTVNRRRRVKRCELVVATACVSQVHKALSKEDD